ncbi:hypothetical protein DYU11_27900 [Fibrisoma montanum]|uniref:TonB-dependent receptor plug domain-containing protein n=1 Tax=Fibrisoma montanum TaxID=2305895 RepID=A0A418LZH7_9BACT|nr:hypothetical protein DYU11_27900 [Fibrisoma montanum]
MVSIPVQQLKAVPALLGESDIIKALALTPGVTTGSEGTTGLQVRGGTPDQNLIILDDAIVYNVSHLFGFVSTFNPDAIHKVDLYKAGFPARYGGRLSSVIDVTMKEGNNQRRRVEAGVGLVGSRLLIEGPLGDSLNGRSSYMVSARSSYFTLFLLPTLIAFHRANSGQYFNYWLYDINAKANHQFRDGGRLLVSVYNGNDFWGAQEGSRTDRSSFNLNWGNTTATLRYTRTLLSNLFFRSTLTYSRYRYSIETQARTRQNDAWETVQRLQASSTVRDLTAKVGFEWTPNTKHTVMAGVDLIKHRFRPTQIETTYALNPDTLTRINASKPATEMAAYLEDELRPVRWLKTNLGLRAVSYQVGARNYEYVEPRLTLNVIPSQRVAVKLAYTQMHQFVHLLSSNSIGLPNDIWVPATEQVPPQASEQTAVGVTYTVPAYSLNLSIDAYLKRSTNLIDYQTGTNFLTNFNRRWETTVERNGVGESRGIEVMASKTQGQLTGWVSYTLARHRRRFATIDQNRWYAASFDRRHVFSMTGQCKFSEKVSGVATWIFQSGQPTTVPISLQENIGQEATAYPILIYGDRNNYRMPAYHRLDLGITVQHRTRRFRNAQWSFGVYNAYNRANPFYLDIERGLLWGGNRQIIGYDYKVVRKAVFPVLPYVSYNLVFD